MINKQSLIGKISLLREQFNVSIEKHLQQYGAPDLQPCHGSILSALYRNNGKLQMKDIPPLIHRTKSTVNSLVENLEKKGYICKVPCPLDGRCSFVELTEKGRSFQENFWIISEQVNAQIWQGFSEEESSIFMLWLTRIMNNMEKKN